jgi:hypothetical protein
MTHGLMPTDQSTGEATTVEGLSAPTILTQMGSGRFAEDRYQSCRGTLNPGGSILARWSQDNYRRAPRRLPDSGLRSNLESFGFNVIGLPHPNMFLAVRTQVATDQK